MNRKCPSCGGHQRRRSSTPESEITWRNQVFSRYRCRDCMLQFRVISRKAYAAAAYIVIAIVLASIAVWLLGMWLNPATLPTKAPARATTGNAIGLRRKPPGA